MNHKNTMLLVAFLLLVSSAIVFSISAKEPTSSETVTSNQEISELKELVTSLNAKVSELEKRLNIVEEKLKFKVVPINPN